ncbi:unnamed protein product [Cyprideis torosa]|uniref:Uncharacterized protein n=1 Tax=Cyprideis torosa TaxID=163714 RepID=A0A7R8ZSC2_9CRUS|nr:unnamed protein product [Cyprideis torosa]CAG0895748.1 unnamed protein product [Cyprideis torosa]
MLPAVRRPATTQKRTRQHCSPVSSCYDVKKEVSPASIAMAPSSGELWGHHLMPSKMVVDCLLPTGVLVPKKCSRDASLRHIKLDLWREIKESHGPNRIPLLDALGPPSQYVFVSVTQEAEREEFHDEERRLCDLKLFQSFLQLVEPEGNKEEKIINSDIGQAIGVNLHEFDEMMKDLEVQDFRRSIVSLAQEAAQERDAGDYLHYAFPPDVEQSPDLPEDVRSNLTQDGCFFVEMYLSGTHKTRCTLSVSKDAYPHKVIIDALKNQAAATRLVGDRREQFISGGSLKNLLKVCGTEEYLVGSYPVSQYKYVRKCLARGDRPRFTLVARTSLREPEHVPFHNPAYLRKIPASPASLIRNPTSIDISTADVPFSVKVLGATYIHVKDVDGIYVRCGVFYGPDVLCPPLDTAVVDYVSLKWNQELVFDINIRNLPRSAKLCVSICTTRRKKREEQRCMNSWGNIALFDFRGNMMKDKLSLTLNPSPNDFADLLNPLGCTDTSNEGPCLEIELPKLPLHFPDEIEYEIQTRKIVGGSSHIQQDPMSGSILDEIRSLASRDPLTELSEQEKEFLWSHRQHCLSVPNALPRLLNAVKWNSRDEVLELYRLLGEWPSVSPETALELLDCKYADPMVRSFACQWLDQFLSPEKFALYMLQLVQTLKFEPYLDNPLTRLLLRRALLNRRIGQVFFWHMKSEMSFGNDRFGLMLEAFCRGLCGHLKDIIRQVEAMDKLFNLSESLMSKRDNADRLTLLHEQIGSKDFLEALQNLSSPLSVSTVLGTLDVESCKIMDSAKRPLWLSWKNPDPLLDLLQRDSPSTGNLLRSNEIIFKNGDDLRQDMLTLQVITIMSEIWRSEGLDMQMVPYTCLSTGRRVGIIEVVRHARTIFHIQSLGGTTATMQFNNHQLHSWIKEHNTDPRDYDKAIEAFTRSCAGYSVATFILGIGDRNPGNIMVNEAGQIFHIDFGHFLGHFKKKLGINRERVPFVLTKDFCIVITKGKSGEEKDRLWGNFVQLCTDSYLKLRKHANLLITLFTMMLASEIPELQSIDDIAYLRERLAVEMEESGARDYFNRIFRSALEDAWTKKVDWFFFPWKHPSESKRRGQ